MRALVYRSPGSVEVAEVEERSLGARDLRIAVEACGVCGSDLASFAHGHYIEPGQIMGHEVAGRVIEAGAEAPVEVGALVGVRPMRGCGACGYCRAGDEHLCGGTYGPSLGYGTPGGFADSIVLVDAEPDRNVFPVAEDVSPLDLLWLEPLAVAVHAIGMTGRAARVLIVGAGAVGITLVAAARAEGLAVTVVEPIASRRTAAESLGAEAFAPGETLSGRFDAMLDATGIAAAMNAVAPYLLPGAPMVMVGLSDDAVVFPAGGHPLQGAFAYLPADIRRAAELIRSGAVRLGRFVTHRYGLDGGAAALAGPSKSEPSMVKVAITPGGAQ